MIDGTGGDARFNVPTGIAVNSAGTLYVTDSQNCTIRKITPAGVVTTFAGESGACGSADGTGNAARFSVPQGAAVDSTGNVYVADTFNHTIRKITPGGVVTTLAGLAGNIGSADGTGSAARFNSPRGVAVDSAGTVYVADTNNHTIRKITAGGVVTTLAGLPGSSGSCRCDGQHRAIQSTSGDCRRRRGCPVCGGYQQSHDQENHGWRRRDDAGGPGRHVWKHRTGRAAPHGSTVREAWRSTARARCMSPTPTTTGFAR